MTTAALVDIGTLIDSIPGVYGGRPRLARSGLPIIQLVAEIRGGRTIHEIIEAYGLDAESGYAGPRVLSREQGRAGRGAGRAERARAEDVRRVETRESGLA